MAELDMPPNNQKIIWTVVVTVCLCAIIGVITEAICVFFKIPDMNTQLAGGFTHVVDTLIGALIAMLINTKAQTIEPARSSAPVQQSDAPTDVKIVNPPSQPVPVEEKK